MNWRQGKSASETQSEIGQLLLYLLGAQARQLQMHKERTQLYIHQYYELYLYIYILCCVYISVSLINFAGTGSHCRSEGEGSQRVVCNLLRQGDATPLCEGGLVEMVELCHKFMSMTTLEA